MSDEKRVKFIVNSDGSSTPLMQAGSDIEAGHPLEPQAPEEPQPRRRRCRKFKRAIIFFAFLFVLMHALHHAAHYKNGLLLRKAFGDKRVDMWIQHHHPEHGHWPHRHPDHGHDPHHHPEHGHWPHHHPEHGHRPHRRPGHGDHEHQGHHQPGLQALRPYIPNSNSFKNIFGHGTPKISNAKALSALANGKLGAASISSLFRSTASTCIPTIPVPGLDTYTFDPSEYTKISHTVAGAVGSDVHIAVTSASEASYVVNVVVSDPKIAEEISLTQTTDNEGGIHFKLEGPRWLNRGECAYASITLHIPASVTNLDSLRTNFIYGSYKLDRELAHSIEFGRFEVNSAVGKLDIPPIRADDVVINNVSGDIHGYYHISSSAAIHSVSGDVNVGVNVRKAEKSTVVTESVSGSVSTRIAGGFDGSFDVRTINGKVEVEDVSDGTNRLHFNKNFNRVKTGTFGPEDTTRTGDSTLRAAAISGNVLIEFD